MNFRERAERVRTSGQTSLVKLPLIVPKDIGMVIDFAEEGVEVNDGDVLVLDVEGVESVAETESEVGE